MTSALEKYYATNYSECNLGYSFLASWKGVAYPTHAIQVISVPFQILAFYVIIFKTPVAMNSVKISLLVNHMCCALLDISICSFSTFYLFLPMYGVFFVGLLSWFKVPDLIQSFTIFIAVVAAAASYVYLFESRSSSLVQNRFRITNRKSRIIHYSIFSLPYLCSAYFFQLIPEDQDAAKLTALIKYPCPTREFFDYKVFIVFNDNSVEEAFIWVLIVLYIHILFFGFFHVLSLIYYLYISPSKSTSKSTQEKQKMFLYCISLQAAVPLFLALFPLMLVFFAFLFGYYSQAVINAILCFVGLHGLVESLVIVIVHKSYRTAVIQMISKFMKTKPSVRVSPIVDLTRVSLNRGQ